MKYFFSIILIPSIAIAQVVTTYDSRFGIPPIKSIYLSVDVGVTDTTKNPDYNMMYRSFVVPSLIDTQYKSGVAITGTITQAEAQLAARIAEQYPASVKFKDKNRRAEAKDAADKAANANSVPALRAEVKRLAELIESLLEDEARQ